MLANNKPLLTLRRGDKVALVAPASGQKTGEESFVEQAITQLHNWGLDIVITPTFDRRSRYLSTTDEIRAKHLVSALTHPEVRAIFVTRGGYGCARLLPFLDCVEIPNQRFLLGFSDITTLHLYFADEENLIKLHAPNLATEQILGDNKESLDNRRFLQNFLFERRLPELIIKPLNRLSQSSVSIDVHKTQKIGGCLSLLVTSLGTPYEVNTNDKWLMIEEVGESPYKIDRMLTHLKNASKFKNVKGVVFGELLNCCSPSIAILEVLAEFFNDDEFPVYVCKDFGHGKVNLPWVYGNDGTVE